MNFGEAYGRGALRDTLGVTLRPGGFELTDRGVELAAFTPGQRVLDLGCGLGSTVARLKKAHNLSALGIDLEETLLRQGRELHPDAPLCRGNLLSLPVGDGSLDGVVCECVLSLFPAPAPVLAEARRVLRPGGRLLLTDMYLKTPPDPAAQFALPEESCLRHALPFPRLSSLISGAGFKIKAVEDHSGHLRVLGAKLALAGVGSACFGSERVRAGYCLVVAQRTRSPNP